MRAQAPAFPERLIAAMVRAAEEHVSPERRREILALPIQGASVAEIRAFLAERHAVVMPASAKRAQVIAALWQVIA